MTLRNAVDNLRTLHQIYSVNGVRRGEGPTFGEYLASDSGKAELQDLRERVDARVQAERRLLPADLLAGVPCSCWHI